MLNKTLAAFRFFLLLCSFRVYTHDHMYVYNFFIGADKISVTYVSGLPIVSFNGERIVCPCGHAPTTIVTQDDHVYATCESCSKPVSSEVIIQAPVVDQDQEQELERRALKSRSNKNSSHRNFE